MPLTLSDQDLVELQNMIGDFRHKEATSLIQFMVAKQRQQQAAAKAPQEQAAPPPDSNGHDANPYAEQTTATH
jgi:hypothetical protein